MKPIWSIDDNELTPKPGKNIGKIAIANGGRNLFTFYKFLFGDGERWRCLKTLMAAGISLNSSYGPCNL